MATTLATLKTKLNNFADETVDATKAALWINDAYKDVASRMDWSWLVSNSNFQTVVGDHSYTLASDLLKLLNIKTSQTNLKARDRKWLYDNYPEYPEYPESADITTNYGEPSDYLQVNRDVWLFPIPKTEKTVYYLYKKQVTELTQDSDEPLVPEQFREVIAQGAYLRWLVADEADEYMLRQAEDKFERMIQKMITEEQTAQAQDRPAEYGRREI
jgi:hypothetical protein